MLVFLVADTSDFSPTLMFLCLLSSLVGKTHEGDKQYDTWQTTLSSQWQTECSWTISTPSRILEHVWGMSRCICFEEDWSVCSSSICRWITPSLKPNSPPCFTNRLLWCSVATQRVCKQPPSVIHSFFCNTIITTIIMLTTTLAMCQGLQLYFT